ncbi:MAG: heme lyase CcmF/NrfE family subunit [Clostridia bacterium]|nr:heme lyase CcmF/NrfE family subunit [Clostridia bacterium]
MALWALAGELSVWLVAAATAASLFANAVGAHRSGAALDRLLSLGRGAATAAFLGAVLASGLLLLALVSDRFQFAYVAGHSSRTTPFVYKIGAFWGGQEGSLLLWLLLATFFTAWLALRPPRDRDARPLLPWALSALSATSLFFALVLAFAAPPFRLLPEAPPDGLGLNSLLRDPSMLLHPLALYTGFVGFSVPFAFAVAGLLSGQTGPAWVRVTRRWGLFAWAALSLGILMGANWSYHVLGWGGYWAFDPVENAALLPWLTGTAYLHTSVVQEKRGLLKAWNAALVAATYLLTILGTFLTRSGIVTSVHSFAQSPIGAWFLAYLGLAAAGLVLLLSARREALRDERPLETYVSKEGSFLLNNVVFLSLAFTVLFGTLLPLVSPIWGPTVTVGEPYFTRTTGPLFAVLFALMGVGPLLAWRRASWREIRAHLAVPALATFALAAFLAAAGVRQPGAFLGFTLAFFAIAAVLFDVALAVRARAELTGEGLVAAAIGLFARHPRRYGGYLVHVAVGLVAIGVVGSLNFARSATVALPLGGTAEVAGYSFQFDGMSRDPTPYGLRTVARVDVFRDGRLVRTLLPGQMLPADAQAQMGPTAEIAIARGFTRDLYVVLAGYDDGLSTAGFRIYVNPLVDWIWAGGALLILASLYSLWPRAREREADQAARALAAWAELEYDFRAGKIARPDYLALRAEYEKLAEAAIRAAGGRPEAARAVGWRLGRPEEPAGGGEELEPPGPGR